MRLSPPRRPAACLAAALFAMALAAPIGGCLSPTLPLPPPESPLSVQPAEDGGWALRGTCVVGATVIAVVDATGRGVVVEDRNADGVYHMVVDGDRCGIVEMWQLDGEETSATTRVVLQEVEDGTVVDPSACTR